MTDEMRAREKAICEAAKVDDIGEVSDGFHTFNSLYEQRMILFAALVKAYKDKSWKSYRHEDGEYCFGGGWFIVGIDTPEGSYTYHYENKYWDMFDCIDLPRAKHWDGHTEEDAEVRLMSLKPERKQAAIDALDIAIERYDEIAEKYRKKADIERNDYMDMRDNAYEAQQLAQWLNELKYLREKIEQITIMPEPRWTPCSGKLPSETVIATVETKSFKHRYVCEAVWIPRWTWKASFDEWEDCSEYNEDDDEYYVLEGWYERIHNWDEYAYVAIDDNVIAWMPLPEPYRGGEK